MTGYLIIQIIFWSIVAWLIGAPVMLWRGVPAEMVPGGRGLVWMARIFLPITWLTWIDKTGAALAPPPASLWKSDKAPDSIQWVYGYNFLTDDWDWHFE